MRVIAGVGSDDKAGVAEIMAAVAYLLRHPELPHGTVRIEIRTPPDSGPVISIADSGIGIPQESLPRVVERFYRVDKARSREEGGTGLGLAIVKHVAHSHGGRVEVESELGKGTTFRVYLPPSPE